MAKAAFYDRVQVETSTTGTGSSVAVGPAVTGYLTPAEAGVQDGAVVNYVIEDGDNFEFQIGQTYSSSGPSLSRGTPSLSKISGTVGKSQIELSGSARVAIVPFAKQLNDMRPFVTPQMFGSDGLGNAETDDTPFFEAACAASKLVIVPPGVYRLADFLVPSGTTIIGASPPSHAAPYQAVSEIRKFSTATRGIFRTNGNRDITLQGLLINGVDRSVPGVEAGGDNITLRDLTVVVCSIGYGTTFGSGVVPQTTFIENCRFYNNIYGIRNIVDTTVVGGAVSSNKTHGIYLPTGANHNNINTRIEWNGYDDIGSDGNGWNVFAENCHDNVIGGTIDAGYIGGVKLSGCSATRIFGHIQRSGRGNSGADQQDCHVLCVDCSDVVIDISTRHDLDDSSNPPDTPKYSVWLHGSSTQNENITIMGDVNGCTEQALVQSGNATKNLNLLASGLTSPTLALSTIPRSSVSFEDFINGTSRTYYEANVLGTGAAVVAAPPVAGKYGVVRLGTGTTSSGLAVVRNGTNVILLGGGKHILQFGIQIHTLSTVTDEYIVRLGFIDAGGSEPVDGVYFEYDRTQSPNWLIKTASNSVRSVGSPPSGIAVDTNSHKFRIEVNDDASEAAFYIDDKPYGTITTNIPSGTSRNTAIGVALLKSAGTSERFIDLDYIYHEFRCATDR